MKKIFQALTLIAFTGSLSGSLKAQPAGDYEGEIRILGNRLDIVMHLKAQPFGGTIDIPIQQAFGLEFSRATYEKPNVLLEMNPGAAPFRFKGVYFPDGDSINGEFEQSGYVGTFYLKAQQKETDPWISREVFFKNQNVKLAGTLSLPDTASTHPAVIFASGSGQQNRDENVLGFKVFKHLADIFLEKGYAVLRYDDRGTGKSDKGNLEQATTKTFAGDARAAYTFLTQQPYIQKNKTGMLGHSEGGQIAGIVAREKPLAFVILMAAPAVPGEKLLLAQNRSILESMGQPKEKIEAATAINKKIYNAVQQQNPDWDTIEKMLKDALLESLPKEARGNVNQQVEVQMKALRGKWFSHFLRYNPQPDLAGLKCPVLVLFGEKDTQVPPEINQKALNKIIKKHHKNNFSIKVIPDANHLFQKAETGSPTEYGKLEKAFAPEFIKAIKKWLE